MYSVSFHTGDNHSYVIEVKKSLIMLSQHPFLRCSEQFNEKITCYCLWVV
nr:MAG TPA: hypothetical protein [Caudoviricetes sp.]